MKKEIEKTSCTRKPLGPSPGPQSDSNLQFDNWHVIFVQDCNLRCRYCSTGFGLFGLDRGFMHESVWRRFIDFALNHMAEDHQLGIEFGGGETFVRFDEWMRLVDALKSCASQTTIHLNISVITNGTCLDKRRMQQLADRGINLTFSIDGPRQIHDRYRKNIAGRGTFDCALKNWRYYQKLSLSTDQKPACNIQSVITDDSRLIDVIEFWLSQGEIFFTGVIQLPSRFLKNGGYWQWRERQNTYLQDLKRWAQDQAKILDVPGFLKDYAGPQDLFYIWKRMFLEEELPSCGAGNNVIAIDKDGNLYPCEGFVGIEKWRIGNIFEGINTEKLGRFRHDRKSALDSCHTCETRKSCPKTCFGEQPTADIADNFKNGCGFAKKLVEIAAESYVVLSR